MAGARDDVVVMVLTLLLTTLSMLLSLPTIGLLSSTIVDCVMRMEVVSSVLTTEAGLVVTEGMVVGLRESVLPKARVDGGK